MTRQLNRSLALVSGLALPLLLSAPGFAQQPNTTAAAPAAAKLSQSDMKFVQEAAVGGMAEVDLGHLAEQKAANPQVKQFGARMVQDHTTANAQLTAVATGKGATLPQQLDQHHAQLRDRLSHLSGAEFDRAYIKEMVEDHDKDVKEFQQQAQTGHDADIKSFAAQTLPVLQEHDRMAHEIEQSLTATGSTAPGGAQHR